MSYKVDQAVCYKARENWYELNDRREGFYRFIRDETGYERWWPNRDSSYCYPDGPFYGLNETAYLLITNLASPHYKALWKARQACQK